MPRKNPRFTGDDVLRLALRNIPKSERDSLIWGILAATGQLPGRLSPAALARFVLDIVTGIGGGKILTTVVIELSKSLLDATSQPYDVDICKFINRRVSA